MTIKRGIQVTLLALGLLASLSVIGSAPAQAQGQDNRQQDPRCTITSQVPAAIRMRPNGNGTSAGQAHLSCNQVVRVRVEVQLWADDSVRDGLIDGTYTYWTGRWSKASFTGLRGVCDEDVGADELFSRARVGIVNPDGSLSWSRWARSDTDRFSC